MAWFKCFIRGENFSGQLVRESGLVGFYVTRFVEATSKEDAEARAKQGLQSEPKLEPPLGREPRVFFEEVAEVSAEKVPATQPGFTWFPMENDG